MKYYVYISDAKVDMLLSQIAPAEKRKIATELKVDLKLFSVARKTEHGSDDNRYTRLQAVESFIREFGNLGTIDEPDEYIEGTLPMRWGTLYHFAYENDPVVYFGGSTDKTIIGLGGSSKHIIGNEGGASVPSHSLTPTLVSFLERNVAETQGAKANEMLLYRRSLTAEERTERALDAVHSTTSYLDGPEQRLEFLAKRLLHGRSPNRDPHMQILLATPLYVALAE